MAAVTSPESSPQPRVYFQTPPGTEEPETPVRKQGRVTVKYDRKELRKRLNLEEWIIDQLTDLYDCEVRCSGRPATIKWHIFIAINYYNIQQCIMRLIIVALLWVAQACLCARIAHCVSILGDHISVLCNQTAAIPVTAVDVNDIIAKSIGASQNNTPSHWKRFVNVWI